MRAINSNDLKQVSGGAIIVTTDEDGNEYVGEDTVSTTYYPNGCYSNSDTPSITTCVDGSGNMMISNSTAGTWSTTGSTTTNDSGGPVTAEDFSERPDGKGPFGQ
jgi:hypothetical protein